LLCSAQRKGVPEFSATTSTSSFMDHNQRSISFLPKQWHGIHVSFKYLESFIAQLTIQQNIPSVTGDFIQILFSIFPCKDMAFRNIYNIKMYN
jgi:hypothetical protein